MAEPNVYECKMKKQFQFDGKLSENINKPTIGNTCCVCNMVLIHPRTYHGRVFCTDCFHKYIWTPVKKDCSGELMNSQDGKLNHLQMASTSVKY